MVKTFYLATLLTGQHIFDNRSRKNILNTHMFSANCAHWVCQHSMQEVIFVLSLSEMQNWPIADTNKSVVATDNIYNLKLRDQNNQDQGVKIMIRLQSHQFLTNVISRLKPLICLGLNISVIILGIFGLCLG